MPGHWSGHEMLLDAADSGDSLRRDPQRLRLFARLIEQHRQHSFELTVEMNFVPWWRLTPRAGPPRNQPPTRGISAPSRIISLPHECQEFSQNWSAQQYNYIDRTTFFATI